MRIVPVYRARSSALHAAGAGPAAALCLSLALVCVLFEHPLVVAGVVVAVVGAGLAARVTSEIARSARFAIPFALLVTAINPLVYAEGETLLVRGFTLLGNRFDITLEAVAAGALAGFRICALVLVFALFSACVDPDRLLALLRRVSYRSALTATLATRLVPVLARDAAGMRDAARCRAEAPGRLAVTRAAVSGSLERAVEVAAALEVRGYSAAVRPARRRRAWSRHDLRVGIAATAIGAGAIALWLAGVGRIVTYPAFEISLAGGELVLLALLLGATALPFAGRGGRLGVAGG